MVNAAGGRQAQEIEPEWGFSNFAARASAALAKAGEVC
jgi:hypothetical protein